MNTDSPVTELDAMPTPKQTGTPKQDIATKTPEATVKEAGVVIKPAQTTNVVLTPTKNVRTIENSIIYTIKTCDLRLFMKSITRIC